MNQRGRKSRAALAVVPIQPAVLRPAVEVIRPEPPDHLGEPERQIWRDVFADYEVSARASAAVLTVGLEAHMRARECREVVAREGMTVEGSDGQVKVHALLGDARAQFLSAIKALGLEL